MVSSSTSIKGEKNKHKEMLSEGNSSQWKIASSSKSIEGEKVIAQENVIRGQFISRANSSSSTSMDEEKGDIIRGYNLIIHID